MSIRIRVYDSRIHALSLPGGMLYRWNRNFCREVTDYARVFCPMAVQDWGTTPQRSNVPGRLKASHSYSVGGNGLGCFGNVMNSARYAKWVHEGTYGPIRARGTRWKVYASHPYLRPYMKFNINGIVYRKTEVRGQKPQPWLAHAAEVIGRVHGLH